MVLSDADRDALAAAVRRLERPGLAGRLVALSGKPAAYLERALPAGATAVIAKAAALALERALAVALYSIEDERLRPAIRGRRAHSALACASGAVGGAFGLAALPVELPFSTTIMLRAIAAIAREEGEDLGDPQAALACLEVFALGAPQPRAATRPETSPGSPQGEGRLGESGYFAIRAMLARALAGMADHVVDRGVLREGAPHLVRFVARVAGRFGVVVSQKLMAQTAAVLGAFGGAAINLAFAEHFQDLARAHFTVRRLERIYGTGPVRDQYERLRAALAPQGTSQSAPRLPPPGPRFISEDRGIS
ncbi:MAG TPA: EcsC family protein [Stellaceae bacterium]|nr:EcsC family protein [Stellaceae bacterium]